MMLLVRKNTSSSIRMTHLVEGRIFMVLNRSIRDKIYLRQMRGIDGYLEHKVTIQKTLEGSEEMEDKREKLARLMSLNKMKQFRIMVIRNFFEQTGMTLTDEHFLTPDESIAARTMVYKLVKDCGNTQQLKNLGEVIEDLKTILGSNQHLKNERVVLLHYQDVKSGAIIITFADFSNHFEKIVAFLSGQDISVFQIEGNFGICFEAEEHHYLKTVWGV